MESRAKWTDLIPDTGLKISEAYDQGDDIYTPGISSVLKVISTDKAQVNFTGKTGTGRLKKFLDGDDIPTTVRDKTYTTQVAITNYGEAIEVTKNTIQDRDFDSELSEMKDISKMANYSIDEAGFQLFNGGFATTTSVGGYEMTWYNDGKPQFSTAHPTVVAGGSTQSNASSTGITFGHDNLETGTLALQLQKADNGIPLAMTGKISIVLPLALDREGREELETPKIAENANNAINVYHGGTHDMVTSKFLDNGMVASGVGSNTAWFLINQTEAKLYHMTRQEKTLESDVNIRNKVVTFTVDARFANFSKEYKGTWASKGDVSSYTG